MVRTILISAVVGLACLTVAAAQAPAPAKRFPINGAGVDPCAYWNAKAKGAARNQSDQVTRMVQSSWAQGYLTALDGVDIVNGEADWLDGVQLSQIIRGIDAHCAAHPDDQIVTAVLAVRKDLANMAAIRGKH
jgi:hypothetical protein